MIRTQAELDQLQIPTWFFPSFHGDIRLVATGDSSCDLVMTQLTQKEKEAIVKLSAIASKKGWSSAAIVPGDGSSQPIRSPIAKVAKALEKLLKPERTSITAVLFADGAMAEVRGPTIDDGKWQLAAGEDPKPQKKTEEPVDAEILPSATGKKGKATVTVSKAAVTVSAPIRGCPAPDFTQADLRAKEVLRTFLSPGQVADFNRYNKFVSQGQTSGNHYMITSRHARDELAKYTRTLFDLDRRLPLCVHDWDVPAAEEMLSLHILLQLPGWENYLRVTEDNLEQVLAAHLEEDPILSVVHGPFGDPNQDHGPAGIVRGGIIGPTVAWAAQRGLI